MSHRVYTILFGAFAFGSAAFVIPAFAMDEIGQVTASFGGETLAWSTLQAAPDETTVDVYESGATTQIDLSAHDLSVGVMNNMLSITGTWIKADTIGKPALEAAIDYLPKGVTGAYWSSQDAPEQPSLILTVVTKTDAGAHVEGQFTAQLCAHASMGAVGDLSDCKPISGTFSTEALTN